MKEPGGRALHSYVSITFFTLVNALINYLTLTVLAYFFGAGSEIDALFAAMTIPQVVLGILQSIVPAAFVPWFIKCRAEDEANSWRAASIAANALFAILAALALLGTAFSGTIIRLINPGFPEPTSALSASLFPYFILSLALAGLSVLLSCLYYAERRFLRPLIAQAAGSAIILACVWLLHGRLGLASMAVGTLAGGGVQFLLLHAVLFRRGRYALSLDLGGREIVSLLVLTLPLLLGSLFYKMNVLVERFISSRLPAGSMAYLGYAGKINSALLLFLTQGVSVPLFQRLSEHSAAGDFSRLRDTLSRGLRAMILLAAPVAMLIAFSGRGLVRLAFERGSFSAGATRAVSVILLAYLGYLAVSTVGLPVLNTLYSLQLTTLVSLVGLAGFLVYVLLAALLARGMGAAGIALAASLQSLASIAVFTWIALKRIGGLRVGPVLRCLGKAVFAAAAAFAAAVPLAALLRGGTGPNLAFLLATAAAFCAYGALLLALRTEEVSFITDRFRRRQAG